MGAPAQTAGSVRFLKEERTTRSVYENQALVRSHGTRVIPRDSHLGPAQLSCPNRVQKRFKIAPIAAYRGVADRWPGAFWDR